MDEDRPRISVLKEDGFYVMINLNNLGEGREKSYTLGGIVDYIDRNFITFLKQDRGFVIGIGSPLHKGARGIELCLERCVYEDVERYLNNGRRRVCMAEDCYG